MSYAALGAAEFVRGVGLVASGAMTYGLLGGALPAEGGYDRLVAYASFATIALGALDLLLLGAIASRTAAGDRKSTRLNSSHIEPSRMPSSA